jgi:hypothetical protein
MIHEVTESTQQDIPARLKLNSLGLTEEEATAARSLMRNLPGVQHPTLAQLIRHAELYGTDLVYETAEDFLAESELVQLALELNRIDGRARKGVHDFRRRPKLKRLSTAQKLKTVAFLIKEGAPHSRIAMHLGVTERQVRRLARETRKTGLLPLESGKNRTFSAHPSDPPEGAV